MACLLKTDLTTWPARYSQLTTKTKA